MSSDELNSRINDELAKWQRYHAFVEKSTHLYFFAAGFISCALINLGYVLIQRLFH